MHTRLFAALAAVAAGTTLVLAGPSAGSPPPIFARALGVGTMSATTFHASAGAMALEAITVAPGGSFGWHTHGSPVAVVVTQGTLTVFDPAVAGCSPFKVGKGGAFVEPANHVHLARNDGSKPVKLYAMYLGIPKSGKANVPAAAPPSCSA